MNLALSHSFQLIYQVVQSGPINLFTVRHEPGRLCHTLVGHRDLVSSLSLNHDEKSLFSASWDGEAIVSPSLISEVVVNIVFPSNGI